MNLARPATRDVQAAFNGAAHRYEQAAALQRRVCELLLQAWAPASVPLHLLDAGCGTGHGARLLRRRWPAVHVTGADLAPAMLAQAAPWLDAAAVADIEALPWPPAQFDAWWSSLCLQWCDASRALAEAARVLQPGGHLALSTLGPGTFDTLRDAFSRIDTHAHTLQFTPLEALHAAMEQAGLQVVSSRRHRLEVHHPDLRALLHAIKAVGAHALSGRRPGLLGRRAWAALEAAYERHRGPKGLPLTYEVLLLCAVKPAC